MATEYKLSYTAEEIDRRLGKVDEIEDKQDKLTFDEAPTEGSDNIVTSGAIHAALQNVGGTDLVAGDFIEIKDGVVRCTFGDVISGELKEEIDEVFGVENVEMEQYQDDPVVYEYCVDSSTIFQKLPKLDEKLTVEFIKPDGTKKTFEVDLEGEVDEFSGEIIAYYNCEEHPSEDGKEQILTKINENLDALCFFMDYNYEDEGEEYTYLDICTFEDFTGASLFVGHKTITDTREYALLPDNALGLGREIVTEVNEEIVNVESIEMYYEDGYGETFFALKEFPEIGSNIKVQFTPVGMTEPVFYTTELVEFAPLSDDDFISYAACCNASYTEYGPVILDESLPAFILATTDGDGNDEGRFFGFFSLSDYNGASIIVTQNVVKKTYVTLPNEALNFDTEPTEGSTNLVNSGVLYNVFSNLYNAFGEIEDSIPKFTFDNVPTENSENLLTSGNIYNSLRDFEKNLPKPQLTEGIIYSQEDRKGFSTNEKAPPTGDNAWIEGTAGYVDIGWSFTLDQSAKKITLYCNEEGYNYAEEFSNNIKSCNYLYVIFEQEPEKKYFIKTYETQVYIDGYYVYFYYDFINGFDSFPIDPSYKIKKLIGLFRCGSSSHAEGCETIASGSASHAEGCETIASSSASHAEGDHTIANGWGSHVQGRYNVEDNSGKYAHIVGNGTRDTARSNAHTLDWNGNAWYAGDVECGAIKCNNIKSDGITITSPILSLPTEIFSGTFQSTGTGNIIGAIIEPFEWYQVILDGIESIAISFAREDGSISLSGKGFSMYKPTYQNSTNISTEAGDHTIVINKLRSYDVGLINYVSSLEDRIAQLEAKLNS